MHRHCGSQTIRNSKNGTIVGHKEEKQHKYNAKVGKSNKQQEEQERKWKRMALHGCAIPGKGQGRSEPACGACVFAAREI